MKKISTYIVIVCMVLVSLYSVMTAMGGALKYGRSTYSVVGKAFAIDTPSFDIATETFRLCQEYQVPFTFVWTTGLNESGWRKPNDSSYIRICGIEGENSLGDLQVNMKYYPDSLPRTRLVLLEYSISLMRDLYDKHKDWRKVRFVYGRGHWRGEHTWTPLERKFMSKTIYHD